MNELRLILFKCCVTAGERILSLRRCIIVPGRASGIFVCSHTHTSHTSLFNCAQSRHWVTLHILQ